MRKPRFHVVNDGYWSSFRKIEDHGTKLSSLLVELESDPDVDRIRLVGNKADLTDRRNSAAIEIA